jgi:hypothetical protein
VVNTDVTDVEAVADEPLTTKEGWRRFVDRQPHPPVLLGAVRLAKLSERDRAAYDDGRRGYHADLPLVSHPNYPEGDQHLAVVGPAQPQSGVGSPRGDHHWGLGHREDHRINPVGPHPRTAHSQAVSR